MTIQQKIESACIIVGINKTELAHRLGMSQQNFSKRLKVGKFSDDDFKNIAQALGCKYYSGFEFPDGKKVEWKDAIKTVSFIYTTDKTKKL